MTVVEDPAFEEIDFSGTFYHPDYGYVVVSTQLRFRIDTFDIYPSQGILVVSGAGNTKARFTAVSTVSYQVEADTDGDGSYDYDYGLVDW